MTAKENLGSPENAKVEERGSTIKVPPLPDHYAENRLVRIMGLKSRPDLNGKLGVITKPLEGDGPDERMSVVPFAEAKKEILKIKKVNVTPAPQLYDGRCKLIEEWGRLAMTCIDGTRIEANGISHLINPETLMENMARDMNARCLLAGEAYTFWKGGPTEDGLGTFDRVLRMLDKNEGALWDYGDVASPEIKALAGLSLSDVWYKYCKGWGDHRITGDFHFFEDIQAGDGSYVVHAETKKVYKILGLQQKMGDMLGEKFQQQVAPPIRLTLLPFLGKLIFDGLILIAQSPPANKVDLAKLVVAARDAGKIIDSLPASECDPNDRKKSDGGSSFSFPSTDENDLDDSVQDRFDNLKRLCSVHPQEMGEIWVIRKSGSDIHTNPNRLFHVVQPNSPMELLATGFMNGAGLGMDVGEVIAALDEAVSTKQKTPETIMIDALPLVGTLNNIFKKQNLTFMYYPAMAKEDIYINAMMQQQQAAAQQRA